MYQNSLPGKKVIKNDNNSNGKMKKRQFWPCTRQFLLGPRKMLLNFLDKHWLLILSSRTERSAVRDLSFDREIPRGVYPDGTVGARDKTVVTAFAWMTMWLGLHDYKSGGQWSNKVLFKKIHSGFSMAIRFSFHALGQFFIIFSRAIASVIKMCSS